MNKTDTTAMLRVNQAGEYGATRIYAGQLAVMGNRHPDAAVIAHMAAQEERHLETFNAMMNTSGVRPTALQPLWHVAGFALGAATALIGPKAAMACTAAIETEIDQHYSAQLEELGADHPALSDVVAQFRDEELEHKAIALEHHAEQASAYPLLTAFIRAGCRTAIALSKAV